MDIYLDLYDVELKEAVSVENDKKIVESIKKGIGTSSHLLCLVSDKTRLSWWVPYEVGVVGERGKTITTLKLKGEYGGEVEHLGRCELNTFVAVN